MVFNNLPNSYDTGSAAYTEGQEDSRKSQGIRTETTGTNPETDHDSIRQSLLKPLIGWKKWRYKRKTKRPKALQNSLALRQKYDRIKRLQRETEASILLHNLARLDGKKSKTLEFANVGLGQYDVLWPSVYGRPDQKVWMRIAEYQRKGSTIMIKRDGYPLSRYTTELFSMFW
ncbi:hypothetical protein H072_2344 [Dactylellina haptotyla CBS 200.50]|uniref:Uncharacterized protein n=1 Tax=Dactylellina haptotyla (strain CBS 200.50) TaxID=1284197 RepID=S8ARD3_DACHA|nr:hypothetical protein H072_2344 [Dactylellina haptotyla CBS 200.50]